MGLSNVDIRDAFFDKIYEIASKDKDVIVITADAGVFSLNRYKKDFPNQFINVGVAEQNMVTVAAGLALSGKKVFICAIIPFITMRCYEHIKVNICSMNLPVTIVGIGAGLSFGFDGPTHHAMQDISVMRTLPELQILNPCDSPSASICAEIAYTSNSPVYVRIDKGAHPSFYKNDIHSFEGFKIITQVREINILSTGYMTHTAFKVFESLSKNHNLKVGIVDICKLKPIDENEIKKILSNSKLIITLEENSIVGGLGTIISEILTDNYICVPLKRIALKDKQYFIYGSREWLHEFVGIDVNSVINKILTWVA